MRIPPKMPADIRSKISASILLVFVQKICIKKSSKNSSGDFYYNSFRYFQKKKIPGIPPVLPPDVCFLGIPAGSPAGILSKNLAGIPVGFFLLKHYRNSYGVVSRDFCENFSNNSSYIFYVELTRNSSRDFPRDSSENSL